MTKPPTRIHHSKATRSGSPSPGEPEFLAVGKLRRPHGIDGDMLMMVWTDFPERLQSGKQVFVGDSYQPVHIKNFREHGQNSIVSFEEFNNREDVGKFRNQVIYVRTSDLPNLPNGEVYLHRLLGMKVISDEDDAPIGVISEIIETGANHVFVVQKSGQQDVLIPDIDPVVLNIDVQKGEILVHLLPGLLLDSQ